MADVTIYHNPRCSKSREALAMLEAAGVRPTVVKYLETPPDTATLDLLLKRLNLSPDALMRTGEDRYTELGLKGKTFDRAEGLRLLAENPILIERPIVVRGEKAIVARPPERVNELL